MQERLRPFAKENIAKTVLLLLSAAAAVLFFAKALVAGLKILLIACVAAFLIVPLSKLFEKKFRRSIASLLALLSACALLTGVLALLLPVLIRQLSGIAELIPEALLRLRSASSALLGRLQLRIPELSFSEPDFSAMEGAFSGIARRTVSYAGNLAGSAYQLALSMILSYFLMADRDRILLRAELFVPAVHRTIAVRMGTNLLRQLRLYLKGQAVIALCVAALACSALLFIGVKAAPLLGLIVGLLNVIPYFGPFIGGIPAVIMALSISWQKAIFTVIALFLVQQADSLILSPRIMGSITGFSPAIVLLSVFLAQQCAGIWGMLFVMPLMLSIRTIYRVFVQRHEKN